MLLIEPVDRLNGKHSGRGGSRDRHQVQSHTVAPEEQENDLDRMVLSIMTIYRRSGCTNATVPVIRENLSVTSKLAKFQCGSFSSSRCQDMEYGLSQR